MSEKMNVAKTIQSQLGNRCLMMIGAKNLCAHDETKFGGLSFKTGRVAAGKANHVKIILNGSDTYDVTFMKLHGINTKVINKIEGAYVDMLHDLIETNTGLYTSL